MLFASVGVWFLRGAPPMYHSGIVVATSTGAFVLQDARGAEREVHMAPGVRILDGRTSALELRVGERVIVTGPFGVGGSIEARSVRIINGQPPRPGR